MIDGGGEKCEELSVQLHCGIIIVRLFEQWMTQCSPNGDEGRTLCLRINQCS